MLENFRKKILFVLAISMILLTACSQNVEQTTEISDIKQIKIDGSSTVYPLTNNLAKRFVKATEGVAIDVKISGTSGGFKEFIAGNIDIANASRSLNEKEINELKDKSIDYIELKVAMDGIAIIANMENDFIESITADELKKVWQDSEIKKWSEVRAGLPDEAIELYGPGGDSGTLDYFKETIISGDNFRSDYMGSEFDWEILDGVESSKYALGFVGASFYFEHKDKLKVLSLDAGKGAITPSHDTIKIGDYAPLSRPLFVYVNRKSLEKEEVRNFLYFYLDNAALTASKTGFVELDPEDYQLGLESLELEYKE